MEAAGQAFEGYRSDTTEDRPLASYGTLIGAFNAIFALFLLIVKVTKRDLPERVGLGDLVLLGVATHKLSRLLAKDTITSALRAPVARFEGAAGAGEVNDAPRGTGLQHSLGELVTCPFCLAQWIASFFTYGLVFAPRVTRLLAGIFTMVTISDFLQFAYDLTKKTEQ